VSKSCWKLHYVTKSPKSCQRKRLLEARLYGPLAPFRNSFVIGLVVFGKSVELADVFKEAVPKLIDKSLLVVLHEGLFNSKKLK
jgi:hypothetical protein